MSKAKAVAAYMHSLVSDITTANGYLTDIGLRVFRGRIALDDSCPPCVTIIETTDSSDDTTANGTNVAISQRFVFEAALPCDPDNPNDAAHDVICDLMKAVFRDVDPRSSGIVGREVSRIEYISKNIVPRKEGTSIVSASIAVNVRYSFDLKKP